MNMERRTLPSSLRWRRKSFLSDPKSSVMKIRSCMSSCAPSTVRILLTTSRRRNSGGRPHLQCSGTESLEMTVHHWCRKRDGQVRRTVQGERRTIPQLAAIVTCTEAVEDATRRASAGVTSPSSGTTMTDIDHTPGQVSWHKPWCGEPQIVVICRPAVTLLVDGDSASRPPANAHCFEA